MITVYGIKNCDTVKKACNWFSKNNIDYQFHDFRKDGLSQAKLKQWASKVDWEILLNRRGTTWRKISDLEKESINKTNAIKLMAEQPTLIKRPVIEHNSNVLVGFSEDTYKVTF
ncbi:MAG: ArsC family reductase [Gammaproteobacteria bacterium]|nr:ArsC family reductase [Gammaproteobacteria bacterium]